MAANYIGQVAPRDGTLLTMVSQGLPVAIASFVYLVVIHKLEYLLNSRIIGDSIDKYLLHSVTEVRYGGLRLSPHGLLCLRTRGGQTCGA